MTIGKIIQHLRDDKGLNQKELAEKVGLSHSVMNRIELGTRPARDEELKKIAEVLDVSLDYLMGASDIRNPYNNKIPKMTQREKVDYDDFMKQAKVHFMGASSEDQDAIFKDLSDLYFESKEINRKKFNPKKNKQ